MLQVISNYIILSLWHISVFEYSWIYWSKYWISQDTFFSPSKHPHFPTVHRTNPETKPPIQPIAWGRIHFQWSYCLVTCLCSREHEQKAKLSKAMSAKGTKTSNGTCLMCWQCVEGYVSFVMGITCNMVCILQLVADVSKQTGNRLAQYEAHKHYFSFEFAS